MASIYQINKGINKPIEFKGLKAQYIAYLAVGLVILLILFAAMYIIGINLFICISIIAGLGTGLFMTVFRLSHKYGQYGLLKKAAKRYIPNFIKSNSRKIFYQLNAQSSLKKEKEDVWQVQ
ncbi:MAG TPA: DUF4133 domain-containing protein [Sphingobacteriaceae bacterium]|nr:DUF4133 domain-containing protein [Sphingobacteriaceae bacterium]